VTSDIVPEDFRVKIEVMSLRTEAHKFYQGQTDTTTLMSSAGNNICYANTLTNSAKLCPSWKDDCRSTTEQIPSIFRKNRMQQRFENRHTAGRLLVSAIIRQHVYTMSDFKDTRQEMADS